MLEKNVIFYIIFKMKPNSRYYNDSLTAETYWVDYTKILKSLQVFSQYLSTSRDMVGI